MKMARSAISGNPTSHLWLYRVGIEMYELYLTTLCKEGFVINPYDRCVANKVINEK